jgi:hypothetical protein
MRKTFPWLRELLTRFLASWIAGAKSQEGENPNGGRTGRSALRTLCVSKTAPGFVTFVPVKNLCLVLVCLIFGQTKWKHSTDHGEATSARSILTPKTTVDPANYVNL